MIALALALLVLDRPGLRLNVFLTIVQSHAALRLRAEWGLRQTQYLPPMPRTGRDSGFVPYFQVGTRYNTRFETGLRTSV